MMILFKKRNAINGFSYTRLVHWSNLSACFNILKILQDLAMVVTVMKMRKKIGIDRKMKRAPVRRVMEIWKTEYAGNVMSSIVYRDIG